MCSIDAAVTRIIFVVHLLTQEHDIYDSLVIQVDKTELKLDEDIIIWPNGLHRKPDGILTRRNVSVSLMNVSFLITS